MRPRFGASKAGSISERVIEFCCARNAKGRGKFVIDALALPASIAVLSEM